jgi:hypothetical protein
VRVGVGTVLERLPFVELIDVVRHPCAFARKKTADRFGEFSL